jgi:hypothetical protein
MLSIDWPAGLAYIHWLARDQRGLLAVMFETLDLSCLPLEPKLAP